MIKNAIIIIDIDDTIIDHNDNLLPNVREGIMALFEFNELWAWSHGGKDYALKVLKSHELRGYFTKVISKPNYYIDDLSEAGMMRINFLNEHLKFFSERNNNESK